MEVEQVKNINSAGDEVASAESDDVVSSHFKDFAFSRINLKAKFSSEMDLYRKEGNNPNSTASTLGRHLKKSLLWGSFRMPSRLKGMKGLELEKTHNLKTENFRMIHGNFKTCAIEAFRISRCDRRDRARREPLLRNK